MGRYRWTSRLTVEDCHALVAGDLIRAGCLKVSPGVPCVSTWRDGSGALTLRVPFTVCRDHFNRPALRLYHRLAPTLHEPARTDEQVVPFSATKCHFGGVRHWLRCSIVRNGYPCNIRAGVLYSTPWHHRFACRVCLHLTYKSAQTHDKRIDKLLKLPPKEFAKILEHGTMRERLLAVRASTAQLRKLIRKQASLSLAGG